MKNVLHVFSSLDKGGAESRVMDLYRELGDTEVQFIFAVTTPGEHYFMNEIRNNNGKILHVKSIKNVGLFSWIKQWKSFIIEHNINVIHSHTGFDNGMIAFIGWFFKVPVRISHARDMLAKESKLRERVSRIFIRLFSTELIACSTEAGQFLFGKGTMMKHGHLIPNAIKLADYVKQNEDNITKIRHNIGLDSFDLIVGTVGNLRQVKNQEYMLDILKSLISKRSRVALVIVGKGNLEEMLRTKAEQLQIDSHVFFLGQRNDVPELLNTFDLFLLTSISEGLPGSVVEALASNVPCLISDTITKDLDINTGLLHYCDLNETPDIWAKKILDITSTPLPDQKTTHYILRKHFFDVKESLQSLLNIYLK